MNEYHTSHSAISMSNKMFVIDRRYPERSEVYENISRKFTTLNTKFCKNNYSRTSAIGIGRNIVLFYRNCKNEFEQGLYDVDNNELTFKEFITTDKIYYSAVQRTPKT